LPFHGTSRFSSFSIGALRIGEARQAASLSVSCSRRASGSRRSIEYLRRLHLPRVARRAILSLNKFPLFLPRALRAVAFVATALLSTKAPFLHVRSNESRVANDCKPASVGKPLTNMRHRYLYPKILFNLCIT
jgi:hypothetical protein